MAAYEAGLAAKERSIPRKEDALGRARAAGLDEDLLPLSPPPPFFFILRTPIGAIKYTGE
jgi:hypothetical protein